MTICRSAARLVLASAALAFAPKLLAACPCGPCAGLPGLPTGAETAAVGGLFSGWLPPRSIAGVSGYNNECRPSATADGSVLVFQADADNGPAYHPSHIGSGTSVYWARWFGDHWDSVMPIDSAAGWDGGYPFVSSDGSQIFMVRTIGPTHDIWVTHRRGDHWLPAQRLPYPVNTDTSADVYPCLSQDGRHLYFCSNRNPKYGGRDVFRATWTGSIWDSVVNLGPGVNKPRATNWNPSVNADETRLYFSREQYSLFGPQELWVSTWTGTEWGEAENVGAPLNSYAHICSSFLLSSRGQLLLGGDVSEGGFGSQDLWVTTADSAWPAQRAPSAAAGWRNTAEMDSAWYVHCLMQTHSGAVFCGTGPFGRVYKTTNCGGSWTLCAELPGAVKVYSLLELGPDTLLAGTYPRGDVFRSTDAGATWSGTANLAGATSVFSLAEMGGTVFAATCPPDDNDVGRVFRTTDRGGAWSLAAGLPRVVGGVLRLRSLSDGSLLAGCYAASANVFRSTDTGSSWQSESLPAPLSSRSEWTRTFGLREVAPGVVWCGGWVHSHSGLLWRSSDHGRTWDTTRSRIVVGPVRMTMAYDIIAADDSTVFVGFQPARDSGVYATTNSGRTWVSTGVMPGVREVLCLLKAADGTVLAGTTPNGDVYRYFGSSIEAEAEPVAEGPTIQVRSPGRGSAQVNFSLPRSCRAELAVHDLTGRAVAQLLHGPRPAGIHRVVWNAPGSGVYLLRLSAAGRSACAKFVATE